MNTTVITILNHITNLGSSLVLGGIITAFSLYLLLSGHRRYAVVAILGFLIPASIIGTLKIMFYTCETNLLGIESPSGHTAISIGVFCTIALLLYRLLPRFWGVFLCVVLFLLSGAIAISREILGLHSAADVIVGSVIGSVVVAILCKYIIFTNALPAELTDLKSYKDYHYHIRALLILIGALVVVVLTYGQNLPSEKIMEDAAHYIGKNYFHCR